MLAGMIDSHCHLDFYEDPEAAVSNSLRAMITVGTTVQRNSSALNLARKYENVWAAVGIHPNNASDLANEEVPGQVTDQAAQERVVAIGETGFDNHWDRETLETQARAFEWHARLAQSLDLPLILHVRDKQGQDAASREATRAIVAANQRKGVLHCFNGDEQLLEAALDLGWHVSFAGNLTYRSATRLQELAREIPEDRLMVETDSPYLSPMPHRGKQNQPANVTHTARFLAELRGTTLEHIEAVTDRNAIGFYGLPL